MFYLFLGFVLALVVVGFYYCFVYYPELCVMLYKKGVYTKPQAYEKAKISKKRFDKLINIK